MAQRKRAEEEHAARAQAHRKAAEMEDARRLASQANGEMVRAQQEAVTLRFLREINLACTEEVCARRQLVDDWTAIRHHSCFETPESFAALETHSELVEPPPVVITSLASSVPSRRALSPPLVSATHAHRLNAALTPTRQPKARHPLQGLRRRIRAQDDDDRIRMREIWMDTRLLCEAAGLAGIDI